MDNNPLSTASQDDVAQQLASKPLAPNVESDLLARAIASPTFAEQLRRVLDENFQKLLRGYEQPVSSYADAQPAPTAMSPLEPLVYVAAQNTDRLHNTVSKLLNFLHRLAPEVGKESQHYFENVMKQASQSIDHSNGSSLGWHIRQQEALTQVNDELTRRVRQITE